MKKLLWWWKKTMGRSYRFIPVKKGLEKNEILIYGHKIYFLDKEE
jgi:hypothetical protein